MKALSVCLTVGSIFLGAATTPPAAAQATQSPPSGAAPLTAIEEGSFVAINGVEQWIAIRGDDMQNPVLLWVHGGPGGGGGSFATPVFRQWERYYTVVQWDQRGAGSTLAKNADATLENFTIERITSDGIAVAEHLRQRLYVDKILLMGISWGSMIGVEMAHRRPDLFSAYVGTAQHASGPRGRRLGYELALQGARQRGDTAGIAELERIGPPPYERVEDFVVRQRYALGFPKSPAEAVAQAEFIKTISAPTPADAKYVARNLPAVQDPTRAFYAVLSATLGETGWWEARRLGLEFSVPFFVFHGANDINTPTSLALEYCEEIKAPAKACEVIPDAGHNTLAFSGELLRLLNEHVRPVILGRQP